MRPAADASRKTKNFRRKFLVLPQLTTLRTA